MKGEEGERGVAKTIQLRIAPRASKQMRRPTTTNYTSACLRLPSRESAGEVLFGN